MPGDTIVFLSRLRRSGYPNNSHFASFQKKFPRGSEKKLSIMVFAIPRSASYGCAATPYLHANLLVQCFGSIAAQAVSPSRVPASPHQHLPYLRSRSLLQELDALNCVFIRLSISIWQAQS